VNRGIFKNNNIYEVKICGHKLSRFIYKLKHFVVAGDYVSEVNLL